MRDKDDVKKQAARITHNESPHAKGANGGNCSPAQGIGWFDQSAQFYSAYL
jgi:hypothetical protein